MNSPFITPGGIPPGRSPRASAFMGSQMIRKTRVKLAASTVGAGLRLAPRNHTRSEVGGS
jgi:hypothetical protein